MKEQVMNFMTKCVCVSAFLAVSMSLTGCGVTSMMVDAKETFSDVFSSKTPIEKLDAYEAEQIKVERPYDAAKPGDPVAQRRLADRKIRFNSAMIAKCDEIIEDLPALNVDKNDEKNEQAHEDMNARRASYIAALTETCTQAKKENVAVSIPTGDKYISREHEAYAPLRAESTVTDAKGAPKTGTPPKE